LREKNLKKVHFDRYKKESSLVQFKDPEENREKNRRKKRCGTKHDVLIKKRGKSWMTPYSA